jgi:hypothetical protein
MEEAEKRNYGNAVACWLIDMLPFYDYIDKAQRSTCCVRSLSTEYSLVQLFTLPDYVTFAR